ncbi:GntR family transcriptional regulator [Croceitalea sp. MTPC5]|uniref:GntR family transcriptional regulator n=1 Tax=Croceitalea sp. MTPC5 TaxID=3056565 RepID=UPI002B3C4E13|nr:GntR family transcriptional regulator [Croceitalea sp. MTPC5]
MQPKAILRNRVRSHLLSQITKGTITIGKTLNLAQISRDLGISVTPIREALSQLEQARIVNAIPNRGFVVPELSFSEAGDLYETIAQLEMMALEGSSFKTNTLAQLKAIQKKLQQAHSPSTRVHTRMIFHHILVGDCANKTLLSLLQDLEARVVFYEQLLLTEASFYEQVDNQNESIIQAIEEDNIPTAALILKMNWMAILEHIRGQLVLAKTVDFETIEG